MFKSLIKKLNWKEILKKVWAEIYPKLEKLVESTPNQFDDATLKAIKHLVEKLIEEEKNEPNS